MKNQELTIFAGPCSVDEDNIKDIYEIAKVKVNGKKAIAGTRVVGLKSRTELDIENSDNGFMGLDMKRMLWNFNVWGYGGNKDSLRPLPSVQIAKKIYEDTGLIPSSEIMLPAIQLACIAKEFTDLPFFIWTPSVNQLGWPLREMAGFAHEYGWTVGIKNAKWLGEHYEIAEKEDYDGVTSLEKTWAGLVSYAADQTDKVILVHRGVDIGDKHGHRNVPVHETAKRTKLKSRVKLYFDSSHIYGPTMRDHIVEETIKAMKMKINNEEYLYDGILIETGHSKTDAKQHISVRELQVLVNRISKYRKINSNNR
jgi:hypothetical protein